ncbi:MAG: protein-(glutamine-N5) methyltransferase, release factor-specific [Rhodospirillaceae bacterium]|nr:protein-(glutamine-N5) methyltransferase, release factor-specific [Rhodospirillaceae bacterium]|tara:strand:- start:3395 stop:4276 length:882 start_codon:yes stop_codon:yes gene_type:complete
MYPKPAKETTSVKVILEWAKEKLLGAQIESPILDARLLLGFALGIPRERFYGSEDETLTKSQAYNYTKLIERRCKREPVSRIIGTRGFWNLTLRINLSSLDPRPDSEILIESILKTFPDKAANLKFIDFGTGTGCLLLSALNEFPNSSGVGVDISKKCIQLAQENAALNGLSQRAVFIESDWGGEVTGKFDIIIANPPYIQSNTIPTLDPEVKNFDPHIALNGGQDGLSCYRKLAPQFVEVLKKGGLVFLEIGYNQRKSVSDIMEYSGLKCLHINQDLGNRDRCLVLAHRHQY